MLRVRISLEPLSDHTKGHIDQLVGVNRLKHGPVPVRIRVWLLSSFPFLLLDPSAFLIVVCARLPFYHWLCTDSP